jgi:acid phosphatase
MKLLHKLKFCFLFLIAAFLGCRKTPENEFSKNQDPSAKSESVSNFPHPDHIIFVWFENKKYSSIIGNSNAPYINSLIAKGTLFTKMFAITHPSYPNYVDFFAGRPNGVRNNNCINTRTLLTPNLYTALKSVGKSFAWYSEGLPATGSTVCKYGYYVEKHNPTTIFANVPTSANKTFSSFPTDYTKLENVVCITPNLQNDMHDGTVKDGDTWLKNHLSSLASWCATHNSIFVVYFDENDGTSGNQIPVVALGQPVKVNYKHSTYADHYNWTRTICAMFGAPKTLTANLSTRTSINGCWQK